MKYIKKSAIINMKVRRVIMPDYILCDDMIEDMVEQLSYIKLKTAIELGKRK